MAKTDKMKTGGNGKGKSDKQAPASEAKQMADQTKPAKAKGTKVITIGEDQITAAIDAMLADGLVADGIHQLIEDGSVRVTVETVEVEKGKYLGDYLRFSLGANVTTEDDAITALQAICGGNILPPTKDEGDDSEDAEADGDDDSSEPAYDKRKPSVVKHCLYGLDLAARSRTTQRVKSAAEGPDKAIERMIVEAMKANPKLTREKAKARIISMLADEDDE